MDSPFVTINEAMKNSLSGLNDTMGPEIHKVEMDNPPSTGFAAVDASRDPAELANVQEPAGTPPKKASPTLPDEKFDSRMAKLANQAQKVRQEQLAIKAEREKLAADMAELERYRQLKAIAKEDPVALAEAFEYKPDEYAATLMEKGSMSPERRRLLEQAKEINDLKSWKQQQEEQARQQSLQQSAGAVRREMEEFAAAAGEQYDLVRRTGAFDKVLARISMHYQQTQAAGEPELMSYDDAFALVESELEQQYAPLIESPKFRTRGEAAVPYQAAPSAPAPARKPTGTINSKMRGTTTKPPKAMSEGERMQKAGEVLLQQIWGRRG